MKIIKLVFIFILLFSALAFAGESFIILNKKNSLQSIDTIQLKSILLGEKKYWDNGEPIYIALHRSEKVFATIEELISVSQREFFKFWRKKLFSGVAMPPRKFDMDEEVLRFVKGRAGAIGLVSNDNLTDNSVKKVIIK